MTAVEWQAHITAQKQSGQSVREDCERHELSIGTFRYHARAPKEKFVQVAGREQCELNFSDGTVLRFPSTSVVAVLEALLER